MEMYVQCNKPQPVWLQHFHDTEWGVPTFDGEVLFEYLILAVFQVGIGSDWVLRRREAIATHLHTYFPERLAALSEHEVEGLLRNPAIIRNRRKIESAIRNARVWQGWLERDGPATTVSKLWQHAPAFQTHASLPVRPESPESHALAKYFKHEGIRLVGPKSAYWWMQASGMINPHVTECPRFLEVANR